MKAVIYARYSSDNQREESIEGQIRECTAFAEKNDLTILKHYIDRAYSARTDHRPAFQEMIKDSDKHLFDMVIVWKLDRFSRDRYDSARYKVLLKKNNVRVVSATEVISSGADGILLESVLEGFAEYYSADLAEKVTRGMTENALKCKFNGGSMPIGYVIDEEQHFQIDPLTAPFVLEAFKRYIEGATMKELIDFFNEKGIKNKSGGDINYNSIQRMLNNRRYIGEYAFRDIVVPDGIPAIVPKELFDRVQAKLAKNKKSPARHKAEEDYLLTTKLFCGCCGAYMCGESGKGRSGEVHRYYKCVSIKKRRTICNKKSVRKDWIEDIVVNATMKMLMSDTTIDAIVSALMTLQDAENVNLPLYEKQLKETNVAINNLLNAIQAGILNRSTKERFDQLEAIRDELENKIAAEKLAKPRITEEQLRFFLDRFRKLDVRQLSHRRMLIDTFVNAVFLYDDKLVLTYNFREGTETITFDDLKNKLGEGFSGSDMSSVAAPNEKIRTGFSKLETGSDFFLPSTTFSVPFFRLVLRNHNVQKRVRRVPAKDIHRLFSPAAVPRRLLHGQQAIRLRALQRTLQQAENRLPLRVGARHVPRDIQLPLPHIIDGVALSVLPQFRRAVIHIAAVVHGTLRAELEPRVAADSPAHAALTKVFFAIHDDLAPMRRPGADRRAAFLFW